jgi:hypothetical protein
MSIELLSFLFVAVFVVILLTGLPLAFATARWRCSSPWCCSACRG